MTEATVSAREKHACEGCGGEVEVAGAEGVPRSWHYVPLHAGHACPVCGCGIAPAPDRSETQ